MSKSKKRFDKLKEDHPKIDLEAYQTVYDILNGMDGSKKGTTITAIADNLKFKRNKVTRIMRLLKHYGYVEIVKGSNRIPYLVTIDREDKRDWKHGKELIGLALDKNYNLLIDNLNKAKDIKRDIKSKVKAYQNKKKKGEFFTIYNQCVGDIWLNDSEIDLFKMEFGSPAVRYCAVEI